MKKQQGFTLIELMVVMAIIAILATAGLSAYTGYIKKARDTTRIADLKAIENIIMGSLSISGQPPQSAAALDGLIKSMNNGQGIYDPLSNQVDGSAVKSVCRHHVTGTPYTGKCRYTYRICDNGDGFAIGAGLESKSNEQLYSDDPVGTLGTPDITTVMSWPTPPPYSNYLFEIGSCKAHCQGTISGCPTYTNPVLSTNVWPTVIDATGTTIFWQ